LAAQSRRVWPYAVGIPLAVIAGLILVALFRAREIEDRTRQWVVGELSQRFNSDVQLESLRVNIAPTMSVVGKGLSLRFHNRNDLPPMFHVEKFSFHLGVLGIFRVPHRISSVYVQNMTITIPPRQDREKPGPEGQNNKPFPIPHVIVGQIVCNDTNLILIPKKEGKVPLDFDIHDLVLKSVGAEKPFDFHGNLTNAKPKGEIATRGTFGPWDADEPGDTPVSGNYKFTNADLGPLPGIAGILSSTGTYTGQLNDLQVEGETDTPDFSLDKVGKPVPLHTQYSATVNGTDGDTYLHPVRATLLHSLIIANGSVVRSKDEPGHYISLDVTSDKARLEDILRLATKADKPFMTGILHLKTKLLLPPGQAKVLDKMKLDGDFGVTNGHWANAEVREQLESLSRHGEGHPADEDVGSSVSDLRGHFRLDQSVISFKDLTFSVPGAAVDLQGTYTLRAETLDFNGHLRLQAKLSQTVTGKKSFFLKAIDPLFEKKGAGTVLPIKITGTRDNPTLSVSVFHKTIEKSLASDKNQQPPSAQPQQK
jgi:AsmA-like C-terminal region